MPKPKDELTLYVGDVIQLPASIVFGANQKEFPPLDFKITAVDSKRKTFTISACEDAN